MGLYSGTKIYNPHSTDSLLPAFQCKDLGGAIPWWLKYSHYISIPKTIQQHSFRFGGCVGVCVSVLHRAQCSKKTNYICWTYQVLEPKDFLFLVSHSQVGTSLVLNGPVKKQGVFAVIGHSCDINGSCWKQDENVSMGYMGSGRETFGELDLTQHTKVTLESKLTYAFKHVKSLGQRF